MDNKSQKCSKCQKFLPIINFSYFARYCKLCEKEYRSNPHPSRYDTKHCSICNRNIQVSRFQTHLNSQNHYNNSIKQNPIILITSPSGENTRYSYNLDKFYPCNSHCTSCNLPFYTNNQSNLCFKCN